MVKGDTIDLSKLTLEELDGVISLYPWFALARKELCNRMSETDKWDIGDYSAQALYIASRSLICALYEKSRQQAGTQEENLPFRESSKAQRQIFVVGGDYFTPQQYEQVRGEGDIFSVFAAESRAKQEAPVQKVDYSDYCTEALAKIYLDQGYKDKAKEIYSKLSLLYPEKSVYFASLIEKIDSEV